VVERPDVDTQDRLGLAAKIGQLEDRNRLPQTIAKIAR
jgi:hypothetical protein